MKEVEKFAESDITKAAIEKIALKLGFKSNELNASDVHLMYMSCAFETATNNQKFSPWCSVFDSETIKVFEFLEDLEYYWIDGYGYSITYEQVCPAIKDMIEHIKPESNLPVTTIYFTHSGTILKFLTKLNLYKDENKLNHNSFYDERKWRVSKIDSFASNILFVLYKCMNDDDDIEYKIQALHQERSINIPGCPVDDNNNNLCDFNIFYNLFKNDIDNCNFDEMCFKKE